MGFWTKTGTLNSARNSNFGLVRLNDGRVLIDGGAVRDMYCDNEGGDNWTVRLKRGVCLYRCDPHRTTRGSSFAVS